MDIRRRSIKEQSVSTGSNSGTIRTIYHTVNLHESANYEVDPRAIAQLTNAIWINSEHATIGDNELINQTHIAHHNFVTRYYRDLIGGKSRRNDSTLPGLWIIPETRRYRNNILCIV